MASGAELDPLGAGVLVGAGAGASVFGAAFSGAAAGAGAELGAGVAGVVGAAEAGGVELCWGAVAAADPPPCCGARSSRTGAAELVLGAGVAEIAVSSSPEPCL